MALSPSDKWDNEELARLIVDRDALYVEWLQVLTDERDADYQLAVFKEEISEQQFKLEQQLAEYKRRQQELATRLASMQQYVIDYTVMLALEKRQRARESENQHDSQRSGQQ